jgi:hypothetical protein
LRQAINLVAGKAGHQHGFRSPLVRPARNAITRTRVPAEVVL